MSKNIPVYYKDLPKIKFLTRKEMQYKKLVEVLNKIKCTRQEDIIDD